MVPPTYKSPPIPTPPETTKAPESVEWEAVFFDKNTVSVSIQISVED